MKRKSLLVLAIILMAIGFATVSTTLIINGNTNVASNANDFDVYFSKAYENGTEKNTLIQDKKHIAFTAEFREAGEEYILEYEVTNASKNYDVSVNINIPNGNEYIRVTNEFDINPLLARTSRQGTLIIKVIKSVMTEKRLDFEITIEVNAVERTELGGEDIKSTSPYKERTLNGTEPVLHSGLIPVTLAEDGKVTMADTTSKWYSYEEKNWANAVILKSGVTHEVGDTIPEDDIESYFVWIPKYKYKIFDMGDYTAQAGTSKPETSIAKEIEIEFTTDETTDTDTSCVSPKIAGESGTCSVGKWMTHPAFQNFDVTGLWIGKFENGYDNGIIVKPNISSWRNADVATFFKTNYNYKRDLDSHMMKNTEWGAVAYLSHSKYGINGEVQVNSAPNYLTGYGYNTEVGYKASTTGNITGVYDLSGGAWEYVAAYSGIGRSGLTAEELITYAKYFDVYPSDSSINSYNNRILGDATGEMGPFYFYSDSGAASYQHNRWYEDFSRFLGAGSWYDRGGYQLSGVLAGQFAFAGETGGATDYCTSRLVLAVK